MAIVWKALLGEHKYTEPYIGNTSAEPTTILDRLARVEIHQPDHPVLGRIWRALRRGDYKFVVENRGDCCNSIPLQISIPFQF
jgi:hypothetical protein